MGHGDSGGPGVGAKLLAYLPRGNTLEAETFRKRHLLLSWILGLHVPGLFAFGIWQGIDAGHAVLEVVTPAVCLILARVVEQRRVAAFFVTAGLVFSSSVLVHLSHGMIEAHFHFFILVGLIALYQDWVPFIWNAVFTTISHGLGSALSPDAVFNHVQGQNNPWLWATIHGVSVLAACMGVVVFWRSTELEQVRSTQLATALAEREVSAAQAEAASRQSMSDLLVNLARRNQSLLNRQLTLIAELEQREREPEALADLFQLDHLATRIRRNAESLLVLSGDDPPRLWGRPMPLSEVVRAAAAEVEDYSRVEVLVNDHIEVSGRVVADMAHLLAEIIENATTFSPPGSSVKVRSHLAPTDWATFMLSIEDTGIGMSDADLEAANNVLAEPRDVDLRRSTLGFHVVSRLAKRYHIDVRLAPTPGGGLTALVTLPNDLVSQQHGTLPALGPGPAVAPARPSPVALGPAAMPAPAALGPGPALAPPAAIGPAPIAVPAAVAAPVAAPLQHTVATPAAGATVPPAPNAPLMPPPAAPAAPAPSDEPIPLHEALASLNRAMPGRGAVPTVPPDAITPTAPPATPAPPVPGTAPTSTSAPAWTALPVPDALMPFGERPEARAPLSPDPTAPAGFGGAPAGPAPGSPLSPIAQPFLAPADPLPPPSPPFVSPTAPGAAAAPPAPADGRLEPPPLPPLVSPDGSDERLLVAPEPPEPAPAIQAEGATVVEADAGSRVATPGGPLARDAETGDEAASEPAEPVPATTADGLVRRVPGAGLAAALRRDQTSAEHARAAHEGGTRPATPLDREAVRSMLSQFQASQRAGRAIADSPVDLRPPEEET